MDVVLLYIVVGTLLWTVPIIYVKRAVTTYLGWEEGWERPTIAQHEEDDRDLLLEEFHDASLYLWEEHRDMQAERERVESNRLTYETQRDALLHASLHSQHLNAWAQAQRGSLQTCAPNTLHASLFGAGAGLGCTAPRTQVKEVPSIAYLLERGAVHVNDPIGVAGLRMFGMLP